MKDGERFKGFMKENFPWKLDPPDGLSVDDACAFVWHDARCALLHRFGMRSQPLLLMKIGRMFSLDDDRLTALESDVKQRPYSESSVRRNGERTVLWIEAFYWSLRQAIPRSLGTKERADAVSEWIRSGEWDRTRKSRWEA